VLITGAGGSIGSELALIAAAHNPESLILIERSENALFEIARLLKARAPGVRVRALLHDVVEATSTRAYLEALRPHVVLHAAAHKHVPIMEDHPAHAVRNNLFGTKSIADAALVAGVERFVMISTDKAVTPRSVMGATKRFAERYVRSLNTRSGSDAGRFRMVRFGNVLGSACSVAPIWARQVAEGGPVTVTHPEMTRYFMTIPEAASLVIQAASLDAPECGGADIFVLDMGRPVRIVDLAERFVRLQGFEPRFPDPRADEHDITPSVLPTMDVVFTGARPGEKLHEELAHDEESLRETDAPGVLALAPGEPEPLDALDRMVQELREVQWTLEKDEALRVVRRHAPGVAPEHASDENTDTSQTNGAAAGLHAA
ncbi:MAG: NAD-dependent epimerase/dehydratase family protein, partial [Phycisphaerales bacterium]